MPEKKMWMVRSGRDAFLFDTFKTKNLVAIGWQIGNISSISDKDEIKKLVKDKYPEYSLGKIISSASQLMCFKSEFKLGDKVVTYDPDNRVYIVGEIIGDYEYDDKLEYPHFRKVKWKGPLKRDDLSFSTKNTLGAISTIFEVGEDAQKEITNILEGKQSIKDETKDQGEEEIVKEDMVSRANELIKDNIMKLDWYDMQKLIAGILRAMNYKTRISPLGPDRGKDIEASPDGLMLTEPRIIVEVKHRDGQMGSQQVRSFISVLRGQKGLYVSTGGFSKDAKTEAERANEQITLVDSDMLVNLIIQNYDNFDVDTKLLVPLSKIYWPT